MDFGLTEEQKMVQDMARSFAEKEIAPYVEEDEENH
ncbi:MAG: acyl-CoA dehydrogenase family protein, partial [Clostridiales Family XIII bacterium]|nr:acyl-CoA dehydrogenase family protein [Clostridiales Family XIII bacterium]